MSIPIYSAKQIRAWDEFTIVNEPISSLKLMERAAETAALFILKRFLFESISIFCGPGNNGGDGLAIARLLHKRGKNVTVYQLKFGTETADFKSNLKNLPKAIKVIKLGEKKTSFDCKSDIQLDCIFGSGLKKKVSGWIGKVIQGINSTEKKTISIDLPSGLFVDSKQNLKDDNIIKASETLTFMSPKLNFFFSESSPFVGRFHILDIGLSAEYDEKCKQFFITSSDINFFSKTTFEHKGNNGFLTLIGGLDEMAGAAVIAARAAMKSGAGYVSLISSQAAHQALYTIQPEILTTDTAAKSFDKKTTALAIGPGLGKSKNANRLLTLCLASGKPLVIDADAINLLASSEELKNKLPRNCVLTPHPKELERLIGKQASQHAILSAQRAFSKKYKVYLIQKGAFSKLTCPDGTVFINSTGNPGMGTAGMGDALTGIIGSLLAQGYPVRVAAINGMFLHGFIADQIEKNRGEIGILASDVIENLPKYMNQFPKVSKSNLG